MGISPFFSLASRLASNRMEFINDGTVPPAMKSITVYRVNYLTKTREPIGAVVERRRKDRGDNRMGLLRLARKAYASCAQEAFQIAIDWDEARPV
jgi:hypothetical protein